MTYHAALANFAQKLNKHVFEILFRNKTCKNVFENKPFISFRKCKTIKDSVVRAKLQPLVTRKRTFKCNNTRCNVCDTLNLTREFTSSKTGQIFQINYELDCNAMSVIYLITCKICAKQYVGETTNKWRKTNIFSITTKPKMETDIRSLNFIVTFCSQTTMDCKMTSS